MIATRPLRPQSEHPGLACPIHGLCGFTEVSDSEVHVMKNVPSHNTNASPSLHNRGDWNRGLDGHA